MSPDGTAQAARTTGGSRRADYVAGHEAIRRAAAEVLAERPQATAQEIAAQCGVHRATLYRHFPTREELVLAVYERYLRELLACLELPDPPVPLDEAGLTGMTRALAQTAARYRPHRYAPLYPDELAEIVVELRAQADAVIAAAAPGLMRQDLTAERLRQVWLAPIIYASGGTMDAEPVSEMMLAGVLVGPPQ